MASRKVDFALAVRSAVKQLDEIAARIQELDDIFRDSDYEAGEADEITDADIEGHDMTAQDMANASILAENLDLFLNNGAPMQYDYVSAINRFRGM